MHNIDELRTKIHTAGWALRELPIRRGGSADIRAWKMIAIKGERSLTLDGLTLNEAVFNMAKTLGLVK